MFIVKVNNSFLARLFRPTSLVVHLNSSYVNPKTNTEFQMKALIQYFKKHVKIDYPDDWHFSKYLFLLSFLILLLFYSDFPFYFFISVMLFFIIGGFIANFVKFK